MTAPASEVVFLAQAYRSIAVHTSAITERRELAKALAIPLEKRLTVIFPIERDGITRMIMKRTEAFFRCKLSTI
jgi:hypothetical protein